MAVTLAAPPAHVLLVDVPQLRREMGLSESAEPVLAEQARHVTQSIMTHCQREFARVQIEEMLPVTTGYGLLLSRTPVVQILSVVQDGAPVLDAVMDDPKTGILTRAGTFAWGSMGWAYGSVWWPNSSRSLFDGGGAWMLPSGVYPSVATTYVAGYLLPEDDVITALLAVNGPAKTFTLSAGVLPLLVPGDVFTSTGFTTAANNGQWTVVTRTASVITVLETGLVTEAESASGGNPKTLRVRTVPDDILRAALDTLKAWYIGRNRDPLVNSRSIAGLSISYGNGGGASGPLALPSTACALLSPYCRYN